MAMDTLALIPRYLVWHYTRALADMWRNTLSALWFVYHFFSMPLLVRTFFAPWKRLYEDKPLHFSFELFFERTLINTLMRIVGVFFRIGILLVGAASLIVTAAFGILFLLIWITLPFLLLSMVAKGIALLAARN